MKTNSAHCVLGLDTSGLAMSRPVLIDVERYIDKLYEERELARWILEDIANVEDCPETDDEIERERLSA